MCLKERTDKKNIVVMMMMMMIKQSCIFLETEEKMLIHCIMGNAVYCVVQIIFNGIIVFICNIFYEL